MSTAIRFDNSYAQKLPGFYTAWQAAEVPAPRLVRLNAGLAEELGLQLPGNEDELAEMFSGNRVPDGAFPLAQAYAGHQFGGFSPQLGDGRALLIGEVLDRAGKRYDIQLKGSGRTPYSRGGDGKAALGPVLREYIMGEAMHALGIATTRALAAVTTGETIYRDELLPGAILTRVAASHVRVGTFQFFAARGEDDKVAQLADYVIWRHFPDLAGRDDRYQALLQAVAERQAGLIAGWMGIGFIHGVMNTDNMAISGETIDYGPCAFMDYYAIDTVFSSIDQAGRYAYGNQPLLAQWNLARFAECLLPLLDDDKERAVERAMQVIDGFPGKYREKWTEKMRAKLGLVACTEGDFALAQGFLATMENQKVDFTLAFRHLGDVLRGNREALATQYQATTLLDPWLEKWLARIGLDEAMAPDRRAAVMDNANPLYIPRNHKVEEVIAAAYAGDMRPMDVLMDVLARPFEEREGFEEFSRPAPREGGRYRTFCGT
ncbi:MAG: YdiU family protein [Nitratireductor sp.]